jgi:NOL1/NOP2/sun family putative RNA methylase
MSLPEAFVKRIKHQLKEEADDFFKALSGTSPISVRLNHEKENVIQGHAVPWCSDGMFLEKRPSFTLNPAFHAGCYYVQEASSMFLEQVIMQIGLDKEKILALDACAAPGGKTTHLASLLNDESMVMANETISSRVSVLKENVIKWGTGNIVVTNNDSAAFTGFKGLFDLIVIDAPCSGEGLFRKDASAVNEWSEENCSLCTGRQERILSNLLPALKQDGYLIYCTCTYNPEENEKNVQWLLENDMECIPLNLNPDWGIKEMNENGIKAYAFYPHRLQGEGFFISVLKKKAESSSISFNKPSKTYMPLRNDFSFVKDWVNKKVSYELYKKDNDIFLLSSSWLPLIEFLEQHLRVHYSGTLVGKIKHTNVIPAHELAVSTQLNKNAFPHLKLSREEAITYLRKDDLKIRPSEKGWMLAMFENTPLGWLNNLGNRFNNNYPTEWRIRMKG